MKPTLRSLTAALFLALATTTHAADSALPSSLLASKAPADALSVSKARENTKPGEAIVLRGKIGGRKIALLPKFAMAVLADEKAITSCNDMPGDSCKTPWDYCCESPEKLNSSTATIQVRDEKGKIVRSPLRGLGELKELSTVIVSGTVDAASTKDNLIVNAISIFVEKP
jgi:hypothetical protein